MRAIQAESHPAVGRGQYRLPKDPKEYCKIIENHADREFDRISFRRLFWYLAFAYLSGKRRFDIFNPLTGQLRSHWLDDKDDFGFRSQDMLSILDSVEAALATMNLAPLVRPRGTTRSALRDRAMSQVLLDSSISGQCLEEAKRTFAHYFVCLGSAGIIGHVTDLPAVGLSTDLEVIHPEELLPFPCLENDISRQGGLIWQRTIPFDDLKERMGSRINRMKDAMEIFEVDWGDSLQEHDTTPPIPSTLTINNGISKEGPKMGMEVVRIREMWLTGPRGVLYEYGITSGMAQLHRQDFGNQEKYCPIGFARCFNNSTFHGAGVFDLMFPLVRQYELFMKDLVNNIREADKYGIVVMPQGSWSKNTALRDVGKGLRVLPYAPDPIADTFNPFTVEPHNLRDVPGRIAQYLRQEIISLNPIKSILEEKGRADSAAALNVLSEEVNKALTSPTSGVRQAWRSMWRATLSSLSQEAALTSPAIPVDNLTLDLVGAIIDPETNVVSFSENPIPSISRVEVDVKESGPRSIAARKQEAVELATNGFTDPEGFILHAIDQGLEFEMWMRDYEGAYETVVKNILLMYGDGETNGEVILTPYTVKPELQLRVLNAFMQTPIMGLASPDVQGDFRDYQDYLMSQMGALLPEQVPAADESAYLQAQAQGAFPR